MLIVERAINAGRAHIAALARADNEDQFAREVEGGCWDHRDDVRNAITARLIPWASAPYRSRSETENVVADVSGVGRYSILRAQSRSVKYELRFNASGTQNVKTLRGADDAWRLKLAAAEHLACLALCGRSVS